jgi:hypothetical protein
LQPNIPDPSQAISFSDIAAAVDAFTGGAYPFEGPGDCPDDQTNCPHAATLVMCQATQCVTQADCPGGVCYFEGPTAADKYCRDAAERCTQQ